MRTPLCTEHLWTFREIDGETWNICVRCGFGEQWANGLRFKTTDEAESARLDAQNAHLHDPPGAGWQE
jgi:hypothetical protein